MTANVRKIIAAGFERVYYGPIDSTGYLVGGTTTAPAAGNQDGNAMARLLGGKTSDIQIVEPEIVNITGDDAAQGSFIFPPASNPSFTIEFGVRDIDVEALFQDTKVQDIGDISVGVLQPADQGFPDIFLLMMRRAKSKASGSDGVSQWEGVFIPRANIVPLGSNAFTERAAASYRYRVTANPADVMPWGSSLSEATNGTTKSPILPWTSENRLHVQRFTGDNTEDTFNLAYTPVSDAKTHVWVNGTKQVVTTAYTVDEAAKTLNFTVGHIPPSDAKIVVLYEHTV